MYNCNLILKAASCLSVFLAPQTQMKLIQIMNFPSHQMIQIHRVIPLNKKKNLRSLGDKIEGESHLKVMVFLIVLTKLLLCPLLLQMVQERNLWLKAIKEKLKILERKGTWEEKGNLSTKSNERSLGPGGEHVLPTHIVLKIKRDEDGAQAIFKPRVLAVGNHQIPSHDYDGIHSLGIEYHNLLLIQIIALEYNWPPRHIDIKTAF